MRICKLPEFKESFKKVLRMRPRSSLRKLSAVNVTRAKMARQDCI